MKLDNPREAIGRKIRWHSWDDKSYFIPDTINSNLRAMSGMYYPITGKPRRTQTFVLGKGIKSRSSGDNIQYWIFVEEHNPFKLDDELFEI